jgi:hypothetical protein
MTWIRTGRPPGRAHEVLTNALGREYVPSELVRLYDDPRARPAGDEAEIEAPLDEVEVRSPDPLPEG